jgi:hypothetical protein
VRLAIQIEDCVVAAADDQQCRRDHPIQRRSRKIRPSPARDDRAHELASIRGGDERGRRSGAGAKEAERKRPQQRRDPHPIHDACGSVGQQRDVEPELGGDCVGALFRFSQQVQQQRPQLSVQEAISHRPVALTETTAATAVHEHNETLCAFRHRYVAVQGRASHFDSYWT